MTALKREVIQMVEQMSYVIKYIHTLNSKDLRTEQSLGSELPVTPKMAAFH